MRKAILLLTFVMMVVFLAAISVLAAGDPTQTLTFNFDPQQCEVVLKSSQLEKEVEMKNGEPVSIPHGADVTVEVTPKMGYSVANIRDAETNDSIKQPGSSNPAIYTEAFLTNSVIANVECTTRVFHVDFEVGDILYKPDGGDLDDFSNVEYYYMRPDKITVLPHVSFSGHTFQAWYVVNSNGEKVYTLPKYDENGDENGEYKNQYYIPHTLINPEINDSGVVYLHAEFTPNPQPVIRYDYAIEFDETTQKWIPGKKLGSYQWETPAGERVSGLTFVPGNDLKSDDPENPYLNYYSYIGYKLFVNSDYYSEKPIIPATEQEPFPNTRDRYYVPIVYTLVYENLKDGTLPEGAPTTYTYDTYTALKQPTRRGYQFMGWRVIVDDVLVRETGKDFVLGNEGENNAKYAAKNEKIVLEAIWQAEKYNITYNWGVSADLIANKNDLIGTYGSFEFDKVTFIPNPIRAGYTFKGWALTYTNGDTTPDNVGLVEATGGYNLDGSLHAQEITLTASWEVEVYNVILGGQEDAPAGYTTLISGVQYDAPLSIPDGTVIVPVREGYTFDGYWSAPNGGGKQYIDKEGNSVCDLWDLDGENGAATLYAKWTINQYSITISPIEKIPAGKEVVITLYVGNTPMVYTGEPISLDYQTVFHVVIAMPAGFEIVAWNVDSFTHTDHVFTSSDITVGASDMTLTVQAKPSAPMLGGDVKSIRPISDTEIKVQFTDATIAALYEITISLDDDVVNLAADEWKSIADGQDHYVFGDLQPGTNYYVFVRLKKTSETLSGIELVEKILTDYDEYVEAAVDQLNGMLVPDDGGNAKGVIADTIKQIDALKKDTETFENNKFYQQVQKLINEAKAKLEFARYQDNKIAALETHLGDCMDSGSFSQENKALLNSLCADAVTSISSADNEEDVESIFATAKAAMEAVPVTYLYDANKVMQLESLLGLGQTSGITLTSIEDIRALRRAIADAIAQGNITADSFITIEEATNLLRALDVVSAYSFNLINVQMSEGDVFTLRMTIPESLINCTGLQVAYFNQATGVLELLETKQEGNTLVFKAKQITDFVILADPTVDLTAVIIALGAILLCQLIAIAFVLISRNKAKNSVMHASVALPLFLTIHFLPVANAELIALGLGAAVLLAQIVLMWLLLSSGMIRVFKTKKTAPQKKEVTAVVREEDLHEDPYAAFDEEPSNEEPVEEPVEEDLVEEETATEESPKEEPEEVLDEDAFDEELAEELAREQDEVVEAEEVYDDEEFIEHAPNPYYSLDEEENEYAFDEEEAERVSDVDTTDQEAEETSLSDDPIDGVFGETDVQYGDAGDEGGRSSDEDSYAESYEYGDEADASYAETKVADREETSSEGSVDPASYIVNDDEDLSDEEEMYRYDE